LRKAKVPVFVQKHYSYHEGPAYTYGSGYVKGGEYGSSYVKGGVYGSGFGGYSSGAYASATAASFVASQQHDSAGVSGTEV
jgi:hypothetical protein